MTTTEKILLAVSLWTIAIPALFGAGAYWAARRRERYRRQYDLRRPGGPVGIRNRWEK
jgi:hypothetical protein